MNSLSFLRSAVVALVLSAAASVLYLSMTMFFSSNFAIRITISFATLGYVAYLLSKSKSSFGKLSFISVFLVSSAALLIIWPVTLDHALFSVGFIWLVRTVHYHDNFVYALADLLFSAVSFTAALAAVLQSHSVFMSFWSFFLAQALILPVLHYWFNKAGAHSETHRGTHLADERNTEKRFYHAHTNAQNALRKLASGS